MLQFVIHLAFSKCTKTVQPCFYNQATQLSSLSNEAAFRHYESRGQGPGFCEGKHKLVHSENVSLVYMRLGNILTLTSIYTEGEEESEAELHRHSVGGTRVPGTVGWHGFSLFEDTSWIF